MLTSTLPGPPSLHRNSPPSPSPAPQIASPFPCKIAETSSAELCFHPLSSGVSLCTTNYALRGSQGVVPDVVRRSNRRPALVIPGEALKCGDGIVSVRCYSCNELKLSGSRTISRSQHFQEAKAGPSSSTKLNGIARRCKSFGSAQVNRWRSPDSQELLDGKRFKCKSTGPDDERDSGKSTTAVTEEPDESKPNVTPPSSDSPDHDSPPEPINVQMDAFKLMELLGPEKVDPADVKLLKEKVFGYTTFWVTGQEPFGDLGAGVLFLGNLRGKREEVFAKLQRKLQEVTGSKYNLFMVEEPNSEEPDPRGGPRVSFVLLRKEASEPKTTTLWQFVIAFVLFVITAGSCLELGIATQLSKLPPEVVRYFTNPEVVDPPDLQTLVPYVEAAMPLAYGVLGVQLFHEVGHFFAAVPRKVQLSIPYFIPNITLGSFGAITQFKSILPDRSAKFDVSMAGPLAGGLLSVTMLGVGLLLSTSPEAADDLVQVPSMLFQGSLLLGTLSRAALGYNAMHAATVAIHPLVIAGWCGLTTTAFNLLPVGCLDGGRAMQAAFGKSSLTTFALITYLLLGLGVIGGPLSLPWGLYILICQREPEKPCLNDVSEVGNWRQGAFILATVLVTLTLLPLWDGLAEELGIGLGTPLL